MRLIGVITSAIGGGILVGYYLETFNPWLTTGLALTITGILFGILASSKN